MQLLGSNSHRLQIGSFIAALALVPASWAAECIPIPGDPVSFWFANGNALDDAGGNDGTSLEGVAFVSGQVDQAFEFDGSVGTGIQIADADNLRFQGDFSLEAWIQTTAEGTLSGGSRFADILRKRHRDNGGRMDIDLGMVNGVARFGITDDLNFSNQPAGIRGTTTINDGLWHHVVGVRDSVNNASFLYVDGVLEAGQTDSTSTFLEINTAPWMIGNSPGAAKFPWEGLVDEVGIFNRALPEYEIVELFVAGSGGRCSLLLRDGFEG